MPDSIPVLLFPRNQNLSAIAPPPSAHLKDRSGPGLPPCSALSPGMLGCCRSRLSCCLGLCCDSTAEQGVSPQHPAFRPPPQTTQQQTVVFEPLPEAVVPVTPETPAPAPGAAPGAGGKEGGEEGGEVHRSRIRFSETLGHGWFGWVVSGRLGADKKVVVKILREEAKPEEFERFKQEHEVWASVDHPQVISSRGHCFTSFPMLSLLESVQHSSVKTFLLHLEEEQVSQDLFLQMAIDACAGLAAVHRAGLAVPDLAARNCVLTQHCVLKVGDYGLGRAAFPGDYWPLLRESVPLRWSSPQQVTRAPNISLPTYHRPQWEDNLWGLSILIWELVTRCRQPYVELTNDAVVELLLSMDQSQVLPHFSSPVARAGLRCRAVLAIAAGGLALQPQDRPTAEVQERRLGELARAGPAAVGQILVEAQGDVDFREVIIRDMDISDMRQ